MQKKKKNKHESNNFNIALMEIIKISIKLFIEFVRYYLKKTQIMTVKELLIKFYHKLAISAPKQFTVATLSYFPQNAAVL